MKEQKILLGYGIFIAFIAATATATGSIINHNAKKRKTKIRKDLINEILTRCDDGELSNSKKNALLAALVGFKSALDSEDLQNLKNSGVIGPEIKSLSDIEKIINKLD